MTGKSSREVTFQLELDIVLADVRNRGFHSEKRFRMRGSSLTWETSSLREEEQTKWSDPNRRQLATSQVREEKKSEIQYLCTMGM